MGREYIYGFGTIKDSKVDDVVINGTSVIETDLEASDIKINGHAHFLNNLRADEVRISGSCNFDKNVKCDEFILEGAATISGDLEADTCNISGKITISGDLNAEEMKIASKVSNFNNIYGNYLTTENTGEYNSKYHCLANEIEVTVIHIENFEAKKVAGANVTIGANCIIDLVEFSESLEVHKTAQIKKIVKI